MQPLSGSNRIYIVMCVYEAVPIKVSGMIMRKLHVPVLYIVHVHVQLQKQKYKNGVLG